MKGLGKVGRLGNSPKRQETVEARRTSGLGVWELP